MKNVSRDMGKGASRVYYEVHGTAWCNIRGCSTMNAMDCGTTNASVGTRNNDRSFSPSRFSPLLLSSMLRVRYSCEQTYSIHENALEGCFMYFDITVRLTVIRQIDLAHYLRM